MLQGRVAGVAVNTMANRGRHLRWLSEVFQHLEQGEPIQNHCMLSMDCRWPEPIQQATAPNLPEHLIQSAI